MKKVLATAIIALAPTSAMAADANQFDGFGSIAAGYNSFKFTGGSWTDYRDGSLYNSGSIPSHPKLDGLDVEARVTAAVPLGGNYGAQFDGVFTHTVYDNADSDAYKLDASTLTAHAFWRDPAKGLIGLVGQRTSYSSNQYYVQTPSQYYIGGEGQYYAGNFTLYGQATYGFVDSAYEGNQFDGVNLGVQVRYYAQPNWSVTLKGGYEHQKAGYDYLSYDDAPAHQSYSSNAWLIGGKTEYRLDNSRVSLFAEADYREIKSKAHDVYTGWDYESYLGDDRWHSKSHDFRAVVGVKLNFGSKTLLDRDRSGASLDPVRPLANDMWNYEMPM